jgi:hypothetical protein
LLGSRSMMGFASLYPSYKEDTPPHSRGAKRPE